MFSTVSLRGNTANVILFAECEDCRALLRPEEAVLLQHEATHAKGVTAAYVGTPPGYAGSTSGVSVNASAGVAQVSGEPV